jgi:hypothetical protein
MCSSTFLDDDGRPSFNALQNYGSAAAPVIYYVFDVMVLAGRDVMREPLEKRRELLEQKVLPKLSEPVRYTSSLDAALPCWCNRLKNRVSKGSLPSAATACTSRDCAWGRG